MATKRKRDAAKMAADLPEEELGEFPEAVWAQIWQALRPPGSEAICCKLRDEKNHYCRCRDEGWCRWHIERSIDTTYASALREVAFTEERHRAGMVLKKFLASLNKDASTIVAALEILGDIRGNFLLQAALDHLRTQSLAARQRPLPTISARDHLYSCLVYFWGADLGRPINQSRQLIDFLLAVAKPLVGSTLATAHSARNFLRSWARGEDKGPARILFARKVECATAGTIPGHHPEQR